MVSISLSGKYVPGAAVEHAIRHCRVLSLGIQASRLLSASDPRATLGQKPSCGNYNQCWIKIGHLRRYWELYLGQISSHLR